MKKNLLMIALISASLVACNQKKNEETDIVTNNDTLNTEIVDSHTAQNSLDWAGTYEAVTPCADCPGIKTTILINEDGTYTYEAEYLERDVKSTATGTIMWHDNGNVIHLKDDTNDTKFFVIENGLEQLDQDGNMIEGSLKEHYIFKKKM